MTDFDQWMKNMGIVVTNQPKSLDVELMIFEKLYDLIIDTRKRLEDNNA